MLLVSDNNSHPIIESSGISLRTPMRVPTIPCTPTVPVGPIVAIDEKSETESIKILITSFGPYNEFDPNPSQVLMKYVQKHYRKKNVTIVFQTLETSYEYCEQWIQHVHLSNYDLIIHTGVDGMADAFELEKFAARIPNYPQTDNDNNTSENRAVFDTGDDLYATHINLDSVIKNIQSNYCVLVSEDAGAYLCNFIYYLSSYTAQQRHVPTDIIFVHIPPFENLDLQHQYPIFKNVLDVLIKYEHRKKEKHHT